MTKTSKLKTRGASVRLYDGAHITVIEVSSNESDKGKIIDGVIHINGRSDVTINLGQRILRLISQRNVRQ